MKPDDLIKFIKPVKKIISDIFFEGNEPTWLSPLINYILLFVLIILAIWGALIVISQIIKIWMEQIRPLYYNQDQKRRLLKRQRFADYMEHEIRQLNSREEWKDYRFAELEAEVEAEGKHIFFLLPFFKSTKRGLRREKSLSKALELSSERLVLVEGEPGSGKSVALRHVAEKLAQRSRKDKNIRSVIPLYINLKKLERSYQVKINRELIESFVRQELNRVNDRDIEQFLNEEFQKGIQEGTWLFLFDSFDELPEVLSSVEADTTIRNYAEAIDDFLNGFNKCHGIIASRQFRGPKHLGWPRFHILPLESRRWELIRKAELDPKIEQELRGQLRIASQEIQDMTKNPMFLGILCEDMRDGSPFPENTHSVFENYLEKRLTRDADRLQRRFKLTPTEVRTAAEKVAFCMSIDPNLGLSPTRKEIRRAMDQLDFKLRGNFEQYLNALEYLKLARSEAEIVAGDSQFFTFAHRRFQEYFATCVVLSDLNRISPRQLLTDGRWRETAVVIFQTQPPQVVAPILAEAKYLLEEITRNTLGLIDDPVSYVNQEVTNKNLSVPKPFSWPTGLLPLLGLLQDGFISRVKELPDDIQMQAGGFLLTASSEGTLADQKWSLEVAGITPQPVLLWLLRNGFASESQWLKEVAYRQTARLSQIPDDIAAGIRQALVNLFARNRLDKDFFATHAHLSRLDQASQYINILRLLKWITPIDILLHIGAFTFVIGLLVFLRFELIYLFFIAFTFFASHLELHNVARFIRNYPEGILFSIYIRLIFLPLLWSTFAILAANTGQFTHPFWWPFLLLFPLLYFIVEFRGVIKSLISIFRVRASTIYLGLPIIVATFYVLYYPNLLASKIIVFLFAIPAIPIVCLFLLGLLLVIKDSNFWIQDWIKLQKWLKSCPSSITAQELLNLVMLYHHARFSKSLIIRIREKKYLIATEYSEELIKEFALAIEYSKFRRKQKILIRRKKWSKWSIQKKYFYIIKSFSRKPKSLSKSLKNQTKERINNHSESEFLNAWLKLYTLQDKSRLANLDSDFLDEIYVLLEQIRARRQSSSVQSG